MIAPASHRLTGRMRELHADDRGVTIIEFALLAPVFLVMLVGTLDLGQMIYGGAVLNGAVESAARSSSLETGDIGAADQMVEEQVSYILPGVDVKSTRTSYYDFADIGRAEQWNDANGDGTCNNGEAYVDENGNDSWDEDIGVSGNGGANDVVIYTVKATYDPIFKVPFMPESWAKRTLISSAVRKNQPFADQTEYGSTAGTCD
ncbi:TadE/TadG family type IV pilus assembly protein [Tsuneonella flava]|nr:TadE family protein [Tsuneonella flava]